MKKTKKNFDVFYDKEADVLYISEGKPLITDKTTETKDEVVIRKNKKTGQITGFTILRFLQRSLYKTAHIPLPFQFSFR